MPRRDGLKEYPENTKTKLENTVNERPSSMGCLISRLGLQSGPEIEQQDSGNCLRKERQISLYR